MKESTVSYEQKGTFGKSVRHRVRLPQLVNNAGVRAWEWGKGLVLIRSCTLPTMAETPRQMKAVSLHEECVKRGHILRGESSDIGAVACGIYVLAIGIKR